VVGDGRVECSKQWCMYVSRIQCNFIYGVYIYIYVWYIWSKVKSPELHSYGVHPVAWRTCKFTLNPQNLIRSRFNKSLLENLDRLCGIVVRVLGYRSGGPGSIPATTRKKK
jgi:hypothetical protein